MSDLEEILQKKRSGKFQVEVRTPCEVTERYYRKIVLIDPTIKDPKLREDQYFISHYDFKQYMLRTQGDKK